MLPFEVFLCFYFRSFRFATVLLDGVASSRIKPECNLLNSVLELSSLTMSLVCVFSSASQTCASVYWLHGSRFDLNTEKTGTCCTSL